MYTTRLALLPSSVYICTATVLLSASCSMSHSYNTNRNRLECGLDLSSFKTGWVESKKGKAGHTGRPHNENGRKICILENTAWKNPSNKKTLYKAEQHKAAADTSPGQEAFNSFIHGLTAFLHWKWILHLYIHLLQDFKWCSLNSAWMHNGS